MVAVMVLLAEMPVEQDFHRKLLDHLHEGVYCLDRDRKITFWSKGAERVTGYSAEDVLGRSCSDNILMHIDAAGRALCPTNLCPASRSMAGAGFLEADIFLHHKDGHRVPVSVRVNTLQDDDGKTIGAVEIFHERYDKLAMEEQIAELKKLSLLDALTAVGNRRFGENQVRGHLNEFERSGVPFGILLLDLDNFKAINDTRGHETGDRVLKMVAATLAANIRSFDHVSRWGGEEFVLVLSNVDPSNLESIAEKMRLLVMASRLTDLEPVVSVTVSIGAVLVAPGDTVESLIARADKMLYRSKSAGRNRVTSCRTAGIPTVQHPPRTE